jgi:ATP adenylyltransferase
VADYTELTDDETAEVALLTKQSMAVMRSVTNPHGFNLGINQGIVAGAGIAAHLHQHVVPRWGGDANFLPVIGRTKTMPQLLGDTRDMLAAAWDEMDGAGPDGGE